MFALNSAEGFVIMNSSSVSKKSFKRLAEFGTRLADNESKKMICLGCLALQYVAFFYSNPNTAFSQFFSSKHVGNAGKSVTSRVASSTDVITHPDFLEFSHSNDKTLGNSVRAQTGKITAPSVL